MSSIASDMTAIVMISVTSTNLVASLIGAPKTVATVTNGANWHNRLRYDADTVDINLRRLRDIPLGSIKW